MNVLGIITTLILVGIGCYFIYDDIKLTSRIIKNDITAKKDLENLIDKKTKLYYTKEDFGTFNKNPFDFTRNKFII